MSLHQFRVLKAHTWELATDMSLPFPVRLLHKQRYLMQGVLAFGCLRARGMIELSVKLTSLQFFLRTEYSLT